MTTDGGGPVSGRAAPDLVLRPLPRHVADTEATIWVETDQACQVKALGHQMRTFKVDGHHYALLVLGWDRTVSDQGGVPHLQAVSEPDLS